MAAEKTANFEAGVNGNNITTGAGEASATPWEDVGSNTFPKYDNTHVAHGSLSCKIAASTNTMMTWFMPSVAEHYGRFYLYPTANPSSDIIIFDMGSNGYIKYLTTGKLLIGDFGVNTLTTTSALVNNQWNRISYHCVHSVTVGMFEIRLYTNADWSFPTETLSSPATWNTGASGSALSYGCELGATSTSAFWLDTIAGQAGTWPGPLGLGGDYNIRA